MPLSHELRPPNVLSMTMDYLMNNIMDTGGDGKWADWYEYLWNRTRSLRKVSCIVWVTGLHLNVFVFY